MSSFKISVTLATGLVDLTIVPLKKESEEQSLYFTVVMDDIDFTIIRKTAAEVWENVEGHVLNEHELQDVTSKIEEYYL